MNTEQIELTLKQLEFIIENYDLNAEIFIFKDNENNITGWQLANKEFPDMMLENENAEIKHVLEYYLEVKALTGVNQHSAMIRALRLSKGLTQKELADILGVKRQQITKWENGVEPNQDIVEIMLEHFNQN